MPAVKRNRAADVSSQDEGGAVLPEHPFFLSKHVVTLTIDNFRRYLKNKDVSLVMFYDPSDQACKWSKQHFAKAAKKTERNNHVYAGVDCTKERQVCSLEEVPHVPYFKLYSEGRNIGFYDDSRHFLSDDMRRWVESVPILR